MRLMLAALAATLSLATVPAFAQQTACGPLKDAAAALAGKYHEAPLWMGRVDGSRAVVLTQRPDGKTWTLIIVQGDTACLVGNGTDGHLASPAAAD